SLLGAGCRVHRILARSGLGLCGTGTAISGDDDIINRSRHQPFAIFSAVFQSESMTQPLALVLYEKLLPASQIVNRLQDLNYRAQAVGDPSLLVESAEQAKPLLVLADL